MARKCKDVKFDNAAAKAVVFMHFTEYNMVPELIQMCCDALLQLDCIWSVNNSKIFLAPPNVEAVLCLMVSSRVRLFNYIHR